MQGVMLRSTTNTAGNRRRVLAAFAVAVAGILVLHSGPAPAVAAAPRAMAPKPSTEITARRMRPRQGSPAPRFGKALPAASVTGVRVFIKRQVGFALATIGSGEVPARTTYGGNTWRIDGPQFHVDAADGPEAVAYVGLVSPNVEYAYGASVVDVSTDAGRTWWEAFLGENVTAVEPGTHGLVALVQQSVTNQHLNPILTWQYVSTDGGRHWRYSTAFAAIG